MSDVDMTQRGHQQDAQEFLGFLLEELHEECAHILKSATPSVASGSSSPKLEGVNGDPIIPESQPEDGWMEVGHKQKAAITRSSGAVATESPITRIFGGKIRSEWRVPGNKNSVTLEPYQSLQLDIGSPNVSNITDALKGLTRPENIQGDFSSARGPKTSATKQVFLETLPPVLTLHLKRFQYDSATKTTQKIWKKVGYPLELEIPKEVFPQQKRGALAVQGGLPRYRLIGVIYHHGKSASGGHYTIDVRREDGKEWIRLDDTVIRRVRNEDVAHGGSEEDPKLLAAALEKHKELSSNAQIYEQMEKEQEEQRDSEKGWNQVNGNGSGSGRKASLGVNGMATPALSSGKRTPNNRYGVKDNKVAYLLFYEKIRG
jgi:ubiquitin carboxyl-terminal hydrolase 10